MILTILVKKIFEWLKSIYLYLYYDFRYPMWIKSLRFKCSNTYVEKHNVQSLVSEENISLSDWSDDEDRYT